MQVQVGLPLPWPVPFFIPLDCIGRRENWMSHCDACSSTSSLQLLDHTLIQECITLPQAFLPKNRTITFYTQGRNTFLLTANSAETQSCQETCPSHTSQNLLAWDRTDCFRIAFWSFPELWVGIT